MEGPLLTMLISFWSINKHGHHRQFLFWIGRFLKIFFSETALPIWTKIWWEAPMEGSVLSFLKAEWKVSDTGSAHWASSYNFFPPSYAIRPIYPKFIWNSSHLNPLVQFKSNIARVVPFHNCSDSLILHPIWLPLLKIDISEIVQISTF